MRLDPVLADAVEREFAVLRRRMRRLANVMQRDLVDTGTGDRKADRIPITFGGEVWTTGGISEIAIIVDGFVVGNELVSSRTTRPAPACP
jgi:hypothetical protein